ncbi:uncharacterized protein Bfra_010782 [Botrytis fragariae]|uniref:Uncharacterized protein n=1 Tax=Botrytis fragariae TaxID=1964551 RepID=A0A8H6ALK3_9HELO|nr:uncharacterized protein Bfra_010782 [Botrytis fragariae]KAF5869586.1 hypothetical protein Bfra_010782 [Botrytis fragariae]
MDLASTTGGPHGSHEYVDRKYRESSNGNISGRAFVMQRLIGRHEQDVKEITISEACGIDAMQKMTVNNCLKLTAQLGILDGSLLYAIENLKPVGISMNVGSSSNDWDNLIVL